MMFLHDTCLFSPVPRSGGCRRHRCCLVLVSSPALSSLGKALPTSGVGNQWSKGPEKSTEEVVWTAWWMYCCLPRWSCLRNLCNFRIGEEKGNFSIICKIIKLTATTIRAGTERLLGYAGVTRGSYVSAMCSSCSSVPCGRYLVQGQSSRKTWFVAVFARVSAGVATKLLSVERPAHGNTFDRSRNPTPVSLRADKVKRPPLLCLLYLHCIKKLPGIQTLVAGSLSKTVVLATGAVINFGRGGTGWYSGMGLRPGNLR